MILRLHLTVLAITVIMCNANLALAQPRITFDSAHYAVTQPGDNFETPVSWRFRNTGNQPLIISAVLNSGFIIHRYYPKHPILPGQIDSITGIYLLGSEACRKDLRIFGNFTDTLHPIYLYRAFRSNAGH